MSKPDEWKLMDDDDSAIANGRHFRVMYFTEGVEKVLYFKDMVEAFKFVQRNPTMEHPEIRNVETREILFPKS